jgi:hypothetical protein
MYRKIVSYFVTVLLWISTSFAKIQDIKSLKNPILKQDNELWSEPDAVTSQGAGSDDLYFWTLFLIFFGIVVLVVFAPN